MVWCYYQCWHYLCPPPSVALNDHPHSVADVMQFSNLHKGTHIVYFIQTGDHLRLIATGRYKHKQIMQLHKKTSAMCHTSAYRHTILIRHNNINSCRPSFKMSGLVLEDFHLDGTRSCNTCKVVFGPCKNTGACRLGNITIPGFVPLQEFCSPIRLQHLSVCLHWTLKCCNLIGLQNSCSGTNPGIVMSPNLLLFRPRGGWALPN